MPRTYCGDRVRKLAPGATRGDGDPLDICVLSERAITRNEIIVRARIIGGLQMVDHGEADDKMISVLENDYVWGEARDLRDLPAVLVERLQHYFLTYRLVPGEKPQVDIAKVYGRAHAVKVVKAAMDDYVDMFAPPPPLTPPPSSPSSSPPPSPPPPLPPLPRASVVPQPRAASPPRCRI